jgi:hypothetical protein
VCDERETSIKMIIQMSQHSGHFIIKEKTGGKSGANTDVAMVDPAYKISIESLMVQVHPLLLTKINIMSIEGRIYSLEAMEDKCLRALKRPAYSREAFQRELKEYHSDIVIYRAKLTRDNRYDYSAEELKYLQKKVEGGLRNMSKILTKEKEDTYNAIKQSLKRPDDDALYRALDLIYDLEILNIQDIQDLTNEVKIFCTTQERRDKVAAKIKKLLGY